MLGDVLAGELCPPSPHGLVSLRAELDSAARAAAAIGGWTEDEPLRLSKHRVTGLLRCPRRALNEDHGPSDDVVVGLVVDAVAKLATVSPRRTVTVDEALAFLSALGDSTVADHMAARGSGARQVRAEAAARIEQLAAAWPAIDPAWWPRVEEPVRVVLAGGAVTVAGRLDVLLGGPPTGRPAVVLEVKGGRWYDGMRADGHLYGLMLALRDGEVPAAAVTVVSDGTTQVEPMRAALLQHAAERLDEAMGIAARVAAGEPPAMSPGAHCQHCPVRPDCPAGQQPQLVAAARDMAAQLQPESR